MLKKSTKGEAAQRGYGGGVGTRHAVGACGGNEWAGAYWGEGLYVWILWRPPGPANRKGLSLVAPTDMLNLDQPVTAT
jgi:hypothetical protein